MTTVSDKPQIGVSACLAKKAVRFDGSFIANAFVNNECKQFFDIHTVCPEVEIGMSVPRPVIQLRNFDGEVRLVFSKNPETDLTNKMLSYAEQKFKTLPQLDGYIFKKDSPSCGVFKVAVKDDKSGMRKRDGIGIFARAFKEKYPNVPVEDEGRLNDTGLRENFLERVYAHYRWRMIAQSQNPLRAFRDFHKNYKLILMAKNNVAYRKLGRLASSVKQDNFADVSEQYFSLFMQTMEKVPTQGHHINVMMHILGYLKNHLKKHEKAELLNWFETYRENRVPRITPISLLRHHFTNHENEYMAEQYYLSPFPEKLMLPGYKN